MKLLKLKLHNNDFNFVRMQGIILAFVLVLSQINFVEAKISDWDKTLNNTSNATNVYKEETTVDEDVIAKYIAQILIIAPFLGVIFLIQIVLGGYEWLMARGDSTKIEEAKKRIINAVIGTLLFLMIYVIAYFIISSLTRVTNYQGA